MKRQFPIVWLTGNTGAGKTTLAFGAREYFNEQLTTEHPAARRIIVLDGDEMRATVSVDEGLSPEDRRKHNLRVARLAKLLQSHGFFVLVAVIAPFSSVRSELDTICNPTWVYVKRSHLEGADRPYEAPEQPAYTIDDDQLSIEEARKQLIGYLTDLTTGIQQAEMATQQCVTHL
jgi:adenylylsulfate kinase-like enzyme